MYHAGGLETMIMPALLCGGTGVCIRSGGFSVEHLIEVINEVEATDVLLFSFMFYELLRLERVEERVPASLRRFLVGGDTVMPWAFEDCSRRFPQIELVQLYGLTEGGAVATTLDPEDVHTQANSVGRPMPFSEAQVVREDGSLTDPGEVGEIWVRSPAVSPGYWQRPEINEKTFVDGWCRTGDLGFVNADGYLSLSGRAKDMIRSGGENIYPAEVEKVLTKHEAIADAAVIGVPHERFHEVGCALIITSDGAELDAEAIRLYCREHMAGYKVPKHFIAVEELPRTPSGKVMKFVLRDQYASSFSAA
jgi:fatty-acyl-CoA synthase